MKTTHVVILAVALVIGLGSLLTAQDVIQWEGILPDIYTGTSGTESINITMVASTAGLDVAGTTNLVGPVNITGDTTVSGDIAIQDATEGSGLMSLKTFTASSGALIGATDKIEVNIPTGAIIVATQLRVDVAVTNAGDNTWAAAFSGGSTAAIQAAGGAAAKNTKVNTFFDANGATAIAASETDITLTPQGADFTAGEITAVVYYYTLTALDDAI